VGVIKAKCVRQIGRAEFRPYLGSSILQHSENLVYRSLSFIFLLLVFGLSWPPAQAQASKADSSLASPQGPLAPSNCPNITTQWYASGSVPSGYYKSNSDGNCYPIPACASNQVWSGASQTCGCPSGSAWDSGYGTCHSPCASGTTWNGSSCVSVCSGGQAWNGSVCVCPSGTNWNGSTCGTPPAFTNFSASPTTATIGSSNYVLSWSTSGSPTSGSVSCSGSNGGSFSLSPVASGSGTIGASNPGSTTCTGTVSNSYGTSSSPALSLTAVCPSGTSWNGSSCASVCSGGQTWNGSACVCPSGQVWNGSTCGVAPAMTSFSVSPASVQVGTNYTVSWGSSGTAPVTVTMSCTGANAASYTLSPSASGSGNLPASNAGSTTCSATASNAWGSSTSSGVSVTASCPGDQHWSGSACVVQTSPSDCAAGPAASGTTLTTLAMLNQAMGANQSQGWYQGYAQQFMGWAAAPFGASSPEQVKTGWCSTNPSLGSCGIFTYSVGHTCQSNGTWTNVCPGTNVWQASTNTCVPPPPPAAGTVTAWAYQMGSNNGVFVYYFNTKVSTGNGGYCRSKIYQSMEPASQFTAYKTKYGQPDQTQYNAIGALSDCTQGWGY